MEAPTPFIMGLHAGVLVSEEALAGAVVVDLDTNRVSGGRAPGLWTPRPGPWTLHPAPCTLDPAPYTLYPAPCTLHPGLCTPHPAPWTLNPKS